MGTQGTQGGRFSCAMMQHGRTVPLCSLGAGTIIKQGQIIGSVISNNDTGASMLHIEYYTGEALGSVFSGGPYRRRSDLTSPMFIQYLP